MPTNNIHLDDVSLSQTFGQWLEAFNSNMGKIDALPIPMEYGKNTTMEYLKFTNGKVIMWGRVDFGSKYPVHLPWLQGSGSGYASDEFSIDFPLALVNNNPVVLPHVIDTKRVETFAITTSVSYTTYKGRFWSAATDNGGSRILNIIVIGNWK